MCIHNKVSNPKAIHPSTSPRNLFHIMYAYLDQFQPDSFWTRSIPARFFLGHVFPVRILAPVICGSVSVLEGKAIHSSGQETPRSSRNDCQSIRIAIKLSAKQVSLSGQETPRAPQLYLCSKNCFIFFIRTIIS